MHLSLQPACQPSQALGTTLAKQKALFEWIIVLANILSIAVQTTVTREEGPQLRKRLHLIGYGQIRAVFP